LTVEYNNFTVRHRLITVLRLDDENKRTIRGDSPRLLDLLILLVELVAASVVLVLVLVLFIITVANEFSRPPAQLAGSLPVSWPGQKAPSALPTLLNALSELIE
jgi:hypothetical protein